MSVKAPVYRPHKQTIPRPFIVRSQIHAMLETDVVTPVRVVFRRANRQQKKYRRIVAIIKSDRKGCVTESLSLKDDLDAVS